ncbi:hypothetical protein BASA62_005091 [Batrachochytrium salamandrivorans]|nr:hypothetical protein BASA62_005091 [Batrachochytrium salamandrivorans]
MSSRFQLGECIGRGASASVYRGLNLRTGQTAAIKQLRQADLPSQRTEQLTQEIDLLKQLRHPNIVALYGYEESDAFLNVIMELCENGSLQETIRKFGKFPEKLVALYMSQVLLGLGYLHGQGVIHRDIKSANILSTKDGSVKLADFGIAIRQRQNAVDETVVGSAYWMAPEVIELRGASTASDIWSVGCTSIELFTGHPPYHELAPVSALFRIVSDDHPPIPSGVSQLFSNFLIECFQRDPHLRISANSLCKHTWLSQIEHPMSRSKGTEKFGSFQEYNVNQAVYSIVDLEDYVESQQENNDFESAFDSPLGDLCFAMKSHGPIESEVSNLDPFSEVELDSISSGVLYTNDTSNGVRNRHKTSVGSDDFKGLGEIIQSQLAEGRLTSFVELVQNHTHDPRALIVVSQVCSKFILAATENRQHQSRLQQQVISFLICFARTPPFWQLLDNVDARVEYSQLLGHIITYAPIAGLFHFGSFVRILLQGDDQCAFIILSSIYASLKLQMGERKHELHRSLVHTKIPAILLQISKNSYSTPTSSKLLSPSVALMIILDMSQADPLRPLIGAEMFIRGLLDIIPHLSGTLMLLGLKSIKNLCQNPSLLDIIAKAGGVNILCSILWRQSGQTTNQDIQNQILSSLSCLIKMNVWRQEQAVHAGVSSHLCEISLSNNSARQFAIPILCELAHGSSKCRESLWKSDTLTVFGSLMISDVVWCTSAFEAILFWLAEDTTRLESFLVASPCIAHVPSFLSQTATTENEQIARNILQLVTLSGRLTHQLVESGLVSAVQKTLAETPSIQTAIYLLKILEHIVQTSQTIASTGSLSQIDELRGVLKACLGNSSLVVQQLARRILLRMSVEPDRLDY